MGSGNFVVAMFETALAREPIVTAAEISNVTECYNSDNRQTLAIRTPVCAAGNNTQQTAQVDRPPFDRGDYGDLRDRWGNAFSKSVCFLDAKITMATNVLDRTENCDRPVPQSISNRLERTGDKLQMLPAIAMQALEVSNRPDCSISEFSALIERDVKLTADILMMANSAMFSLSAPTETMHRAVFQLGFRQVKNLIVSAGLTSMMKNLAIEEEWVRELLWRHSFATGLAAVHLNRVLDAGFCGEEFTAGLLHDVGRALLAFAVPECIADVDPLHFDEPADILEKEYAVIGTTHCAVGAWFATRNRLPVSLLEVVQHHHAPQTARHSRRLVALISVADHMANHLQRFGDTCPYDTSTNPFIRCLEHSGIHCVEERLAGIAHELLSETAVGADALMAI